MNYIKVLCALIFIGLFGGSHVLYAEDLSLIPMYGGVRKNSQQLSADKEFIKAAVAAEGTRGKASKRMIDKGWQAIYSGDSSTAMRRFNQAWLLDNDNGEAFNGFGVLVSGAGDPVRGLSYFKTSYKLSPNDPRIVSDYGYAIALKGRTSLIAGDKKVATAILQEAEDLFIKASALKPPYNPLYAYWAQLKFFNGDVNGALQMVEKAQQLGAGQSLPPGFAEMLYQESKRPTKAY